MTHHAHDILFPALPFDMHERTAKSTKDVQLQQFVDFATRQKNDARQDALRAAFGDNTDAMRELAGEIKQHTLDHLDYYIEQFMDRATDAGVNVHLARDDKQANAIVLKIAKDVDARLCVKSKSMVTEETLLVPALEEIGCETIETDLGEFILQLDDDAPSHLVTPMIHKDRIAVAKAFVRDLGADYTEDAGELTQIAREYLRQKFRDADLGISGGNFLIAETGGVVICTNEGNGRLSTSVPDTHIAFVGIEKLIPRLEHLSVMLKLLARSSTGQTMTCYTHVMTGPRRAHEHDGPKQMHVILIDNGRTEVLREETREMLRCIRCGACLNACPVYRKVGGHAYGAVYSGPIGSILTPTIKGVENYPDLPHASSLCGACYEACPVKINIPRQLILLREKMVQQKIATWSQRMTFKLWTISLSYKWSYRFGGWSQKIIFRLKSRIEGTRSKDQNPYTNRGWLSRLPGPIKGWTDIRDMPTPPSKSFRQWWNNDPRK